MQPLPRRRSKLKSAQTPEHSSPSLPIHPESRCFRWTTFSQRASQALAATGFPFAYVNVLEDPEIFDNLPRYADWPTFPQIYINGELVGGCDIALELFQNGELKQLMETAISKSGD